MLKLNDISYTYPNGARALSHVSVEIAQGTKCAVLGSNGAGKSSLFALLPGLIQPQSGEYLFQNRPVRYGRKELRLLRQRIGIVFQDPDHQLFTSSVYDEVAFGLSNMGLSVNETRTRVEKTLKELQLDHLQQRPPHLLSYGQKKRVVIAAVIAMNPDVLVFDEPTSGLDPESVRMVKDIFDDLHRQGKTLIVSTHSVDFAWEWAQQIILLKDGKVKANGVPEEILTNAGLMSGCKLRQPVLVELFEKLHPHLQQGKYPRTIDEFSNLIQPTL